MRVSEKGQGDPQQESAKEQNQQRKDGQGVVEGGAVRGGQWRTIWTKEGVRKGGVVNFTAGGRGGVQLQRRNLAPKRSPSAQTIRPKIPINPSVTKIAQNGSLEKT